MASVRRSAAVARTRAIIIRNSHNRRRSPTFPAATLAEGVEIERAPFDAKTRTKEDDKMLDYL